MAGDWIKVEENMPDKPEVWAISARLGIDPDAAAGKLIRVWAWASRNCNADGVTNVTARALLDRCASVTGFADAMIETGWLVVDGNNLIFPRFSRHCSQTAKERAHTARRVETHRAKCNGGTVTNVTPRPLQKRYQRREEKRKENTLPPADAAAVGLQLEHGTDRPERKARPVDPVFDAFAKHIGQDPEQLTPTAARTIAVALAEIRKAAPGVNGNEIARRVSNYRRHYRDAACTAPAVAKHWALIDHGPGQYVPTGEGDGDKLRSAPENWQEILKKKYPPDTYPGTADAIAANDWSALPQSIRKEITASAA